MKRLAVYCGSASPADPRYLELAREVGTMLAERRIGVVYGGGRQGNTVMLLPPINIDVAVLGDALDRIIDAIASVARPQGG